MAIAFDASSISGTTWGTGSSATWSHTCSGDNRIIFVGTFNNGNGTYPTGITYNGVALTKINQQATDGGGFYESLWYLIAPDTGAHNIVVSWSAGDGINNCIATSYVGAKQSAQPDNSATGLVSSASSITINLTTNVDNCWYVGFIRASGASLSSGTNGYVRIKSSESFSSQAMTDSNGNLSPAGAYSSTINVSPNQNMWYLLSSIAPYTPASTFTPRVMIM